MGFLTTTLLLAASLCLSMVGSIELGYRLGKKQPAKEVSTVDGAVFGILGLILAFTFTGALARFDARRELIIKEANAIGTAYLRIDLLPNPVRDQLRPIYREYLQTRIEIYQNYEDQLLTQSKYEKSVKLQGQIWQIANAAVLADKNPGIIALVIGSTNEMIDVTNERLQASRMHPPNVVYVMLFALAIASAFLVGYNMSALNKRPFSHIGIFCIVISTIIFVILDLEQPRSGLFQIGLGDKVLLETLDSMK